MIKLIRKLPLRTSFVFGNKIADIFRNFSYLIRASHFFRNTKAPYFERRFDMHQYVLDNMKLSNKKIVYIEMGVFEGESIKFWANKNTNSNSLFFGFDTFEGLPQNWGNIPKGTFSTGGQTPQVDDVRINFKVGLFQDTVPPFIKEISPSLTDMHTTHIYHFDADLYSSTLYSLLSFTPFFKAGDIFIFDDIFSITKSDHELRAFNDFLDVSGVKYKPIAKTSRQLSIELISVGK